MINKTKKCIAIVDADASITEPLLEFIKDRYLFEFTHDITADYVMHTVGMML